MAKEILNVTRQFKEKTPYGINDVTERYIFEHVTYNYPQYAGKVYQREKTIRNGIITFNAEYPAFTDYAIMRLKQVTG